MIVLRHDALHLDGVGRGRGEHHAGVRGVAGGAVSEGGSHA